LSTPFPIEIVEVTEDYLVIKPWMPRIANWLLNKDVLDKDVLDKNKLPLPGCGMRTCDVIKRSLIISASTSGG